MKLIPLAIVLTSLSLVACGETPTTAPEAPVSSTQSEIAPPAAPAIAPVDRVEKNVVADGVQFQPEAAKVDGSAIVSTGAEGFVMFGPYVALTPGHYRVTVQGSIPSPQGTGEIRFDAVSSAATATHGELVVNTETTVNGTIAEFDITIPEGVSDLEIRAHVTAGVNVRIDSYQIAKAQ